MHEKAFATGRIRKDFPYYGATYTAEAQVGVRRCRARLRSRREATKSCREGVVKLNLNRALVGMHEASPNSGPEELMIWSKILRSINPIQPEGVTDEH